MEWECQLAAAFESEVRESRRVTRANCVGLVGYVLEAEHVRDLMGLRGLVV